MLYIYALTMLLSAALLFAVQPMVAKMLLPTMGGSSAVWTTCMLFFQALLLGGYAYAHLGARTLTARRQSLVHLALMLVATVALPLTLGEGSMDESMSPVAWLLLELTIGVGLPFLVLASTAPMLQHWFAKTNHPDANDPYHLYAASNLGSMTALLGYPFLIEPWAGVTTQSIAWSVGFGALILATGVCATILHKRGDQSTPRDTRTTDSVAWKTRGTWVLLAFLPSSLMLGVTQYLTTDIAAVPLMWVLPLALYLLTFIIVFAKRRLPSIVPPMALPWLVVALVFLNMPLWAIVFVHLAIFFALALHFHRRLADARPSTEHLTEFYLWMSTGGALGGVFNALIAPVVFDRLVEYFVILALAVALLPVGEEVLGDKAGDFKPKVGRFIAPVGIIIVGAVFLGYAVEYIAWDSPWRFGLGVAVIGVAAVLSYFFPKASNVLLAWVFVLGIIHEFTTVGIHEHKRSFYASYKVFDRTSKGVKSRRVSHGTTSHGAQILDGEKSGMPVAYYHWSSPIGQVFDAVPHQRVGVVGLGAGAMAAYADRGEHFDFYEIDPAVEDIAREWFTYLEDCGERCDVIIGDGRRKLAEQPDDAYDIIVLDAYNSDAIPTHLLTREAMRLYMDKLKPEGVLALHLSNRYLEIQDVAGALAKDAGLEAITQLHIPDAEDKRYYVLASRYTIVAREPSHFGELSVSDKWEPSPAGDIIWTDDYTNIIDVIDWD